jgi:hypothetical protein
MKSWMLVVLGVAIATAAWSQDQSTSQNGSQPSQGSQNQASQTGTNGNQNMSGTVGHDRKTVTNDKNDKRYKVDNPEALQGQEDQHVALIVHFDPDNNVIHVIQVEPPQQ